MGKNTRVKCVTWDCGRIADAKFAEYHGWTRFSKRSRGGDSAFYCPFCRENRGHYEKNINFIGEYKSNGFTGGMEVESDFADDDARGELLANGYIPTHDCTCRDAEFKSPVYRGECGMQKYLFTIESLINDKKLDLGNNGTHLHVGNNNGNIDRLTPLMPIIRAFYSELFMPLQEAILATPDCGAALFGRAMHPDWATPFNGDASDRYNFINVTNEHTVEFRQCKFINQYQYSLCIKFGRYIVENIIEEYDFSDRSSIAKIARKNVKIFEKYYAMALNNNR